jgi:hypothetical protein
VARKEERNKYSVPEKTEEESIRDANDRDLARGVNPYDDLLELSRGIVETVRKLQAAEASQTPEPECSRDRQADSEPKPPSVKDADRPE